MATLIYFNVVIIRLSSITPTYDDLRASFLCRSSNSSMHWEGSVEVPCKSKAPVALLSTCFLWFWMLEIQHSSGTLWLQLWSEGAIDGGSLQGPLQYPMPSQTLPGLPGSSSYLHDLHGTYHNHPESLVIHWLFTGLQHMRVFNWSTQEMRKSLSRSDRGMGQVSVVQWSWKHIATDSNNYIFAELFIIVHNCSSFYTEIPSTKHHQL